MMDAQTATTRISICKKNRFNSFDKKKERRKKMANTQTRQKCEKFSRAMGYYRPVDNFNFGKRAEFEERNTFKECNCLTTGARHQELLKKAA